MRRERTFQETVFAIIAQLAGGKTRASNTRRQWLVFPKFQLGVVFFGVAVGVWCLGVTYFSNLLMFWRSREALGEAGVPANHPVFFFLSQQQRLMGYMFFVELTFVLVTVAAFGILYSHRIAGPLHRLRSFLKAQAEGKVPRRLQFREHDYFKEIADAYNEELEARGAIEKREKHKKSA